MIRLSRVGKKKKAYFRLIISEKTKDPYGRALEILGSYDPHTKKLQAKKEKIEYWLGQGAQMSPTVNNLLINQNIIKGEKIKNTKTRVSKKQKPEAKKEASAPEKKEENPAP